MTALDNIRKDLYARFAYALSTDMIDSVLDTAVTNHSRTAQVQDFVPVLAGRDAYAELTAYAAPALRIEFASRTNLTLARATAAIARKETNRRVVATVAPAHPENSVDEKLEWVMDERGLTTPSHNPCSRTLQAADFVVYLAADEDRDRPGRAYDVWDIPSTDGMTVDEVRGLMNDLTNRVRQLAESQGIATAKPVLTA